ncbi:MAG: gliding motility protein GldN [Muribaculaceae bacterium]|nr:gliding motility protein GldN [Muribaculaceae bacterium]MBR3829803.1 gliding motility protein GldN [Muribaculaceae bacterium]
MKIFKKYLSIALALICLASIDANAQSVVRKRSGEDRNRNKQENGGVTQRMQSFFEEEPVSDADLMWMRVIYRQLDAETTNNAPIFFPEEKTQDQENLFRIIMRLVINNQITAYEYLDGREIFTDQYRINVRDMLDRFHVLYEEAKGSTEKNPKFVIDDSDVPANEVLSYYIIERWEFDSRSNEMKTRVEAICPVLHRSGDFGGEAIKYPMFWVKLQDIRPWLTQQYIFIDDDNIIPKYTYDDYFLLTMYKGDIYKTRNIQNKSMMQLYPDEKDRKRAQDSIQARLENFDKKLWVPDREEIIANREAAEAASDSNDNIEENDSTAAKSTEKVATEKKEEKKSSSRSSRSKKPVKRESKVKESKPKTNSNNAVRSVRRRK